MTLTDRILIVRLSAFGDIVQTLPLLVEVRKRYPTATIGWLVEEAGASLLANHPLLDTLHVLKLKTWLRQLKSPQTFFQAIFAILSFITALKTQRYTVLIDVQGLLKSAIWGWLSGIPMRIGFSPAREQAFRFYTHTHASFHPIKSTLHASQEFLSLLTLLDPTYAIPSVEALQYPLFQSVEPPAFTVENVLPAHWLKQRVTNPIIALAPCTAWASKHWEREHWVTLAGLLMDAGFRVVWLGAKADETWFAELWKLAVKNPKWLEEQTVSCVGKTSFEQLYQLLGSIDCVVGLDSVAFHLANAKSQNSHPHTPKLVGLFGATKPTRTGSTFLAEASVAKMLNTLESLPCMPCHQRQCRLIENPMACMNTLSPHRVLETIQQLLLQNHEDLKEVY
jgi:heptosyltransferase-1